MQKVVAWLWQLTHVNTTKRNLGFPRICHLFNLCTKHWKSFYLLVILPYCHCFSLSQAWQLHEKNCIIDLVDDRLSEFNEEEVKRVVGIALLCTQTSPTLRPSMSRVVAMLSGDIEVSTVTSKPGYLSDWKFEDVSSFMTGIEIKGSDTNYQNSSGSTSMMGGVDYYSPRDVSKPILKETLWEGRWELVYSLVIRSSTVA